MRKNIPDPGFAGDDGSADPRLAAALAAYAADRTPEAEAEVLSALASARLLVPIVAVLGEAEVVDGLAREKSSDMAVPTIQAPDGRRGLPAFTSLAALARWRADARPAPVPTRQAVEAAWQEGAEALLIDLAGPVFYELSGPAMRLLGQGRAPGDALTDPEVTDALRALLAAEPAVLRAHLLPGRAADADADAVLALVPDPETGREILAPAIQRLAGALAADPLLRTRLLRGLDVAVVPPSPAEPAEPLYARA